MATSRPTSNACEQRYREAVRWERVASVTHCVDCYPEACPFKAYIAGGRVLREEQSAIFETVEPGVPDMNPAGCQKGAGWSRMLYGEERVKYPLRRVGERGSGKWERIASVTHCVDCYPEACPFKAYIAGGRVLREEQSAIF